MTYSIKEVADKTDLSIYTLRFYDKQGLLPFVARNEAGYRVFTDGDLALLETICCLKNTGMKIKDIQTYINYVMQGPSTVEQRKELLQQHRQEVVTKQAEITRNLAGIDYKIQMYDNPDAELLVAQEVAAAKADKHANHLPDPYPQI